MHNAALLTQGNVDLRSAMEHEDHKCKRSTKLLVHKGCLTAEEVQDLMQESDAVSQLIADLAVAGASGRSKRGPPNVVSAVFLVINAMFALVVRTSSVN